jgi:hypothetical protein
MGMFWILARQDRIYGFLRVVGDGDVWDCSTFEGQCVCLVAMGSGCMVDNVGDHGMSRMAKSHVPARVLSDDTPLCHLDPESVRQEGASIRTLAATTQTCVPNTEPDQPDLAQGKTHNASAPASPVPTDPRSQLHTYRTNLPSNCIAWDPHLLEVKPRSPRGKVLDGLQFVGSPISGAPEHRKSRTPWFSASIVEESAHVHLRSREFIQLGHVIVSLRNSNLSQT